MMQTQKVKSVRTYYYGVGYLGIYVFDNKKKFKNVAVRESDVKNIRASNIREARRKVREVRAEEFMNSIKILPEPRNVRV